jgi:2-dehydropantoate 2-reductase
VDNLKDDSVLIVGTGALACLFAARLAPYAEISMLGTWQDGIQALNQFGVRLVTEGTESAFPVKASSHPSDFSDVVYALVLVKAWQTNRAAEQLASILHPEGISLTLQNGYNNLKTLESQLGAGRAALGITTSGATLLGPGRIRPGGKGPIHLVPEPKLDPLIEKFERADFEVQVSDDLDSLVWGKLVINAGINPVTALLQIPNGALLEQPDAHALMEAAALEAAAVAEAMGVRLPYDNPVTRVEEVARLTAPNHSSMYQDVKRGAPTEIEAICGAILQEGERLGVPTPVNKVLLQLIRASVSKTLRGTT